MAPDLNAPPAPTSPGRPLGSPIHLEPTRPAFWPGPITIIFGLGTVMVLIAFAVKGFGGTDIVVPITLGSGCLEVEPSISLPAGGSNVYLLLELLTREREGEQARPSPAQGQPAASATPATQNLPEPRPRAPSSARPAGGASAPSGRGTGAQGRQWTPAQAARDEEIDRLTFATTAIYQNGAYSGTNIALNAVTHRGQSLKRCAIGWPGRSPPGGPRASPRATGSPGVLPGSSVAGCA